MPWVPPSPMEARTIILSDLHLGRPDGAASAASFASIAQACDRLIINGDCAELHHERYRALAALELERLRDVCLVRGTKLELLSGNHDPLLGPRILTLANERVLVTHGDAFHPALAPWSRAAKVMRAAFLEAFERERLRLGDREARFVAAQAAAEAEWKFEGAGASHSTILRLMLRPLAVLRMLHYWSRFNALASDFADEYLPHAQIVVVGHSHRAGVSMVRGRTIVNTGAYSFPGVPHALVLDGEQCSLHRLRLVRFRYTLAEVPSARWQLASPACASPYGRPIAEEMNRPASQS